MAALRRSLSRGRPYGADGDWVLRTAALLGLAHTLRAPGRPRKLANAAADDDAETAKTAPDAVTSRAAGQRIGS